MKEEFENYLKYSRIGAHLSLSGQYGSLFAIVFQIDCSTYYVLLALVRPESDLSAENYPDLQLYCFLVDYVLFNYCIKCIYILILFEGQELEGHLAVLPGAFLLFISFIDYFT